MPVENFLPEFALPQPRVRQPHLPATLWNEGHYNSLRLDRKCEFNMYAVLKNDNAPLSLGGVLPRFPQASVSKLEFEYRKSVR